MKVIKLDKRHFQGAVSLEDVGGSIRPWRLPCDYLRLFDDGLVEQAGATAGVRMRFATDAEHLELAAEPFGEPRRFDLTVEGELLYAVVLEANEETVKFDSLPAGEKVVEVWLPLTWPATLRYLAVPDGASVEAAEDERPRWITYGSSITHCCDAHSPARTWPAGVARKHGLNLTCLGFNGQCHLDAMVARVIRDMPADFVSLKLGINAMSGSLGQRAYKSAAIALVKIIREKHPNVPIALVSPIISPQRETERAWETGLTLQETRRDLADAVERLAACGDSNVHYFDGLELFGADLVEDYLPDGLHPNADGYEVLGENFSRVVMGRISL